MGWAGLVSREVTVRGDASVWTVWERYDQLAAWPRWAAHITGVDADGQRLRAGLRGRVHALGLVRVPFVVEEVEPSGQVRRWSWRVDLGLTQLRLEHTVTATATDAGGEVGSVAGVRMWGPGLVVVPYVPVMAMALRRLTDPAPLS